MTLLDTRPAAPATVVPGSRPAAPRPTVAPARRSDPAAMPTTALATSMTAPLTSAVPAPSRRPRPVVLAVGAVALVGLAVIGAVVAGTDRVAPLPAPAAVAVPDVPPAPVASSPAPTACSGPRTMTITRHGVVVSVVVDRADCDGGGA